MGNPVVWHTCRQHRHRLPEVGRQRQGVLMGPMGPGRVRAVTHIDIDANDIAQALERIGRCEMS